MRKRARLVIKIPFPVSAATQPVLGPLSCGGGREAGHEGQACMRRLLLAACGLGFAAALAGCGNATDNLDFKVPPGYQSKLNLFGTEMWIKGNNQNPEV